MQEKNISIGEAELTIMKAVWKAGEPVNSAAIGEAVKSRAWKRTTIATFLARLVDKGALACEKRGKAMYYTPLISAGEYKKTQVKNLVKNVFDGSARDLIASLFEEQALSEEDIRELQEICEDGEA